MANLLVDSLKDRTYDAIVIGSGISGGWSAKELTQNGLHTLLLERGRQVNHITDYPTATLNTWELEHRGRCHVTSGRSTRLRVGITPFVKTQCISLLKTATSLTCRKSPSTAPAARWMHGYQVGGRSLTWGRQTQRWSNFDFDGPARDGFAVDWPIRYADIAPWHSQTYLSPTGPA